MKMQKCRINNKRSRDLVAMTVGNLMR